MTEIKGKNFLEEEYKKQRKEEVEILSDTLREYQGKNEYFYSMMYKMSLILHGCFDVQANRIEFGNGKYEGIIQLYQQGWCEVTIRDTESKEVLFYQQVEAGYQQEYEIEDILQSFYAYLFSEDLKTSSYSKPDTSKEQLKKDLETRTPRFKKILVCCTSGASSSYFASLLQETLTCFDHDIIVKAYPVDDIDSIINQYDAVLLSPQVAYKCDELRKKYHTRIYKIKSLDYATGNTYQTSKKLTKPKE